MRFLVSAIVSLITAMLMLIPACVKSDWSQIPDGVDTATWPRVGNGVVDSPNAYRSITGEWGFHNYQPIPRDESVQLVNSPTAYLFGDDQDNYSGEHMEGLLSAADSIKYMTHDTSAHWFRTGYYDNKILHPDSWATANPECNMMTSIDIGNRVYAYIDFGDSRPAGTLYITMHDHTYHPNDVWHFTWSISAADYPTDTTLRKDITSITSSWTYSKLIGGNSTWSYLVQYNYTGDGDWTDVWYCGIEYTYTQEYAYTGFNDALKREESIDEPYWITYDFDDNHETSYIMNKAFSNLNSPSYSGGWPEPYSFPSTTDEILMVKLILVVHCPVIPPSWFSFSVHNFSSWSYGEPWYSDGERGTTWVNSSVYPLTNATETGSPSELDGYFPMQYTWDISPYADWNASILTSYWSMADGWDSPLVVMWTFINDGYDVKVDYLGIYYEFEYSGSSGGLPEYERKTDLYGMIWLLFVFLPPLLLANVVPKMGFAVGIMLMLIAMEFIFPSTFLPFMIVGIGAIAIMLYKGRY